jgi:syntaxin-binding protein 1
MIANPLPTGSTHTITPRQFIDDLKVLDLGGVGSKTIPNGLQERRGDRSFQEYYDEKYFTADVPPPKPAPTPLATPSSKSSKSGVSPTNSFAPPLSPAIPSAKDEKKKKKGLFRFGGS